MGTWGGSTLLPLTLPVAPWATIAWWTGAWQKIGICHSIQMKSTICQSGTGVTVAMETSRVYSIVVMLHAGGLAIASEQWAHSAGKSIIKYFLLFSFKYYLSSLISLISARIKNKPNNNGPLLKTDSLKTLCAFSILFLLIDWCLKLQSWSRHRSKMWLCPCRWAPRSSLPSTLWQVSEW